LTQLVTAGDFIELALRSLSDGHALDLISGHSGLLQNGATANAPDLVGRAFQFDFFDDVLRLPNTRSGPLDFTNQQLSVAAWINLATTNQPFGLGHGILDKYRDTAQNGYILQVYQGRLQLGLATADQPDFWLTAGPVMPTGQWVHVAGTYDGSRACLYKNGVEVTSALLTGSVLHNDRDTVIGNDNTGSTQYGFNGLIDEVMVFNRALSSTEVAVVLDHVRGAPHPSGFGVGQRRPQPAQRNVVQHQRWRAWTGLSGRKGESGRDQHHLPHLGVRQQQQQAGKRGRHVPGPD
jgi:hypothetical protein